MSELKRYTWAGVHGLTESDSGMWIRHEDYAALQQKLDEVKALAGVAGDMNCFVREGFEKVVAERDALASENAVLKVLAEACSREYESAFTEEFGDDEKVSFPEEQCHITFGMIRSALKTPATDAYLNSVRADTLARIINTGQFSNWVNQGLQEWVNRFNANSDAQLRAGEAK